MGHGGRDGRKTRARNLALAVMVAVAATGCASRNQLTTGSIPQHQQQPVAQMSAAELQQASSRVGAAYEANPTDKSTGLAYASILGMNGSSNQALAVMQQVAINHPTDREVLAAYGKAQAAAGDLEQALQTIRRAQTPDRPDWALLSAEGAILDQLDQPEEARRKYRDALDIKPNEPSVLSNLGMSHLLTGDLRAAETYMKSASEQPGADSLVRQNLALVVGLQGRFDEAERIASSELNAEQAQANVAYLRSILSQQNAWSQLSDNDATATN
jgi:Flp pilus assembly protein TadD